MIKVHIKRKVPEEKKEAPAGTHQPACDLSPWGFRGISPGKSLKRVDKPGESLVVTKWQSAYYWNVVAAGY